MGRGEGCAGAFAKPRTEIEQGLLIYLIEQQTMARLATDVAGEAVIKRLPSKSLSSTPIVGALFVPPVSVDAVGKAAASAVLDPAVSPGVMDVWEIQKYS